MNYKRLLFLLLSYVAVIAPAWGQKIKYKDLFVLLSARQFPEAEPYLKKYLKDNDDNPNAYLYMGLILEEKATRTDILKENERYTSLLDSAVLYYGLAMKGMTEKEVSKNDEYYQMYNRRDARTGKFGAKHSDVLLDLETRMKLKDRVKLAKELKVQLKESEASYHHAVKLFNGIQALYPDLKRLYLQADDSLVYKLGHLATVIDSCHIYFNEYKAIAKSIGRIGYNQDLNPQDITDFKKELVLADFYSDDIKIQDFKRWAHGATEVIEKEIKPMRDQLVARDMELGKLQQQVKKDSVSVMTELHALRAKGFPELIKIEPNPLPLQVFHLKEAEIEFGSLVSENRSLRDTARLSNQLEALRKEIALAKKLDSVAGFLVERNIEEESANYKHFVTTAYGTSTVLKTFIRGTKEVALREVIRRESLIKRKADALNWMVDGNDSIPLTMPVPERIRFKPMIIQEEKYTTGIVYTDSVGAGYFYEITPSRQPALKAQFSVNKDAFKKRYLSVTKAISTQDDQGLVFFVLTYQEAKFKDKYQATLTKIYKVEGLAWSVDFALDQVPVEMTFAKETSELTVKTKSSIGELFLFVVNRDGKLKR
jgi:hypothetical protein